MVRVLNSGVEKKIVQAAKSLVGAPYLHQGRAGPEGVDCVGVLLYCGDQVGAEVDDDPTYGRETNGGMLLGILASVCDLMPSRWRSIAPGRILVFQRGRDMWHTGIMTREHPPKMVHAWARYTDGLVREEVIGTEWKKALHSVWRYRA